MPRALGLAASTKLPEIFPFAVRRIAAVGTQTALKTLTDRLGTTSDAAERRFRDTLHAAGTFTHKRYSGGSDIGAACGQLAARTLERV